MTKLDAGLMTSLPASDPGSAAVWGSKRINPRPQSCLCLTWNGYPSNDDDDDDDDNLVMDDETHNSTKSPDIDYFFVKDLKSKYDHLKEAFSNGKAKIKEIGGWRDDMKFLYHLTCVFRHFIEKDKILFVNFQQIPNISHARWNSRAILTFLAFIVMPETRIRLRKISLFTSYPWADHWFSNQLFRNEDFDELSAALDGCPKGLKCLKNHWKRDESPINVARSNQCCERAIKVMQQLQASCRNKENLFLRFILFKDINWTN